ncbi:MAG: hypothetical protein J6Y15_00950, partial [Bacteroidaceae bacterium]|nr:hypothetical protein [Bacteroidaceae bacterium]
MKFERIKWNDIDACAEVTYFNADNGADEIHAIIHIAPNDDTFQRQLERMYMAEDLLASTPALANANIIFKRYFLSDATNQVPLMKK